MKPPKIIDRYEIIDELGRGAMATVYRARDPLFDREVAIKVLPQEFLDDPKFRTRFDREGKIVAQLEHLAIVPVYDFGEFLGQPYLVMRVMEGGTLADLQNRESLSTEKIFSIIDRIASGLTAAHDKGIIHRDLKPENILFDGYGDAYISDFGIACMQEGHATLTGTGILGTPAYMSPEQVDARKDIDSRSDIYALGTIIYLLLTGELPYRADSPARTLMMHLLEPVPRVTTTVPDLSSDYDIIIARSMAKEREQRYQDAPTLIADLLAVISGIELSGFEPLLNPPESPPSEAPPPEKRGLPKGVFSGGGIFFLMLIAAYIFVPRLVSVDIFGQPSPTPLPTTIPSTLPSTTPEFVAIVQPTETLIPTATITDTHLPTVTITNSPSATPDPSIVGGADKLAFLNDDNNIWVFSFGSSELAQLTTDGLVNKSNLQWTPDGDLVIYTEGQCIKSVSLSGINELVTCFERATFFDAFAISNDGTQVALSVDRLLYILPYELEMLKDASNHSHLAKMSVNGEKCLSAKESVLGLRWSNDDSVIAVKIYIPGDGGQLKENIAILDVTTCDQETADYLNVIPGHPFSQFSTEYYQSNPIIPSFDWHGRNQIVFNDAYRNGYGSIYFYDNEIRRLVNIGTSAALNPVEDICCYRDVLLSPDGKYLLFAFQAIEATHSQLYYVSVEDLGSQAIFDALPLDGMLQQMRIPPQPALRPAP